jgi:phytoene dehydrogenase-like protein
MWRDPRPRGPQATRVSLGCCRGTSSSSPCLQQIAVPGLQVVARERVIRVPQHVAGAIRHELGRRVRQALERPDLLRVADQVVLPGRVRHARQEGNRLVDTRLLEDAPHHAGDRQAGRRMLKLQLRVAADTDSVAVQTVEADDASARGDEALQAGGLVDDPQHHLMPVAKRLHVDGLSDQWRPCRVSAMTERRAVLAGDAIPVRPDLVDAWEGEDRLEVEPAAIGDPTNLVQHVWRPPFHCRQEVRPTDEARNGILSSKTELSAEARHPRGDHVSYLRLQRPTVRPTSLARRSGKTQDLGNGAIHHACRASFESECTATAAGCPPLRSSLSWPARALRLAWHPRNEEDNVAERSIVIIGAGIAGLSAGCYARMNGYETRIFEMHTIPGGVCTAWKRGGYTIDGCLHWLVGSAPGVGYHKLWREVGGIQGLEMIDLDEYMRIEGADGKSLIFYGDADRLEKHLLELAPEDARAIRRFTRDIRKLTGFDLRVDKAPELYSFADKLAMMFGMLPYAGAFLRWRGVSVQNFANRLTNPFLKETFATMGEEMESFPILALIMPLAWQNGRMAGYPLGGSIPFARAIEKRFLDLGGSIRYGARVVEILTERGDQGDRAVGVRLEDGTEHRADVVISAADGRTTIFDMLGGRYVDETIKGCYETMKLFPPLLYIGLGIADPLDDIPSTVSGITFPLSPAIEIDGKRRERLSFKPYNFDSHLAPEGKCAVVVMLSSDYDRWAQLSQNPERYAAEKAAACEAVIDALEQRVPGIRQKVEMRDVATPVTWERFTGNWRGAYEGWLPSTNQMMRQMKKTLPGLDGFYMIGQWTTPGGGLPPAVSSGCHVVQILCNRDRKRFVATVP